MKGSNAGKAVDGVKRAIRLESRLQPARERASGEIHDNLLLQEGICPLLVMIGRVPRQSEQKSKRQKKRKREKKEEQKYPFCFALISRNKIPLPMRGGRWFRARYIHGQGGLHLAPGPIKNRENGRNRREEKRLGFGYYQDTIQYGNASLLYGLLRPRKASIDMLRADEPGLCYFLASDTRDWVLKDLRKGVILIVISHIIAFLAFLFRILQHRRCRSTQGPGQIIGESEEFADDLLGAEERIDKPLNLTPA